MASGGSPSNRDSAGGSSGVGCISRPSPWLPLPSTRCGSEVACRAVDPQDSYMKKIKGPLIKSSLKSLYLELEGGLGHPYSLNCQEGKFSETGLPILGFLGNSEASNHPQHPDLVGSKRGSESN